MRKRSRPFPYRRTFQYSVLFLFVLLIFLTDYPLNQGTIVDIFVKLDPLSLVSTILTTKSLTPLPIMAFSLLTLLSAILFGRVFCGYFCPMGTTIDLLDFSVKGIGGKGRKENREIEKLGHLPNIILLLFLFASLFSLNIAYLLDPLPFITRFYVTVFFPLWRYGVSLLLIPLSIFGRLVDIPSLQYASVPTPHFNSGIATFLLFFIFLLLNAVRYRFFCRYICPLGLLLGILSKWNIFKRKVSSSCNNCGICQRRCPMGAIPDDPRMTITRRCITCYTCVRVCPEKAVHFSLPLRGEPSETGETKEISSTGISRRDFLVGVGGGILSASLFRSQLSHQWRGVDPSPLRHQRVIRPPGSVPEPDFLKLCIRCGECFKVCPTNTLQPIWFEVGVEGLWTPSMRLRFAYCEQLCNLCGIVCPTGAIRALSLNEKRYAKVGTAVIVRERCWAWAYDRECLICDEHCPYNAIELRIKRRLNPDSEHRKGEEIWDEKGSLRVPYVDPKKCNGCGVCEDRCPVEGESAIIVVPDGEIRLKEGSFIEVAKELGYRFEEE